MPLPHECVDFSQQSGTSRKRSVDVASGAEHRAQLQAKNLLSASCAARTRRGSSRFTYCTQRTPAFGPHAAGMCFLPYSGMQVSALKMLHVAPSSWRAYCIITHLHGQLLALLDVLHSTHLHHISCNAIAVIINHDLMSVAP
jgi:hypothetical protein